MLILPEPLRAMASYAQFILWDAVWNDAKQKYEKHPVSPHTGRPFPKEGGWQKDPSAMTTFAVASAAAQHHQKFVGFLISSTDPFFFVDIDGALSPEGQWSQLATELCYAFQGCAVEVSHSGKGLHIFGVGSAPEGHRCRDDKQGLEFYTEGRFVALTGTSAIGDAAANGQAGVDLLLAKYLPQSASSANQEWTTEPDLEWSGPADDDELIKKMLSAKPSAAAAFGSRAPLPVLWSGDEDELAKFYPSSSGDTFDRSSADAALCQHLAFWTGKDCERMQRLFERSGLVRDKWNDREDYRVDTITQSAGWCTTVYKGKSSAPKVAAEFSPAPAPEGTIREGYQFLGLPQQLEFFKDCVYVSRQHAIKTPTGELLKSEQFRAVYGGHWFAMDSINDKISKNAWEVFTESQGLRFPRADITCFRPELPPSAMLEEEGRTLVNMYVPVVTPRQAGDASLFVAHLTKLIPNPHDRELLLSYMAACVQMTGVKFRWCPFIQGVPGNGKSTLSDIMVHAIGRRYSHSPSSKDLANSFNAWMENKLFIYVEDVYTADKQEVLETLKPMITGQFIEIHPKGGEKYMADNRANFILNSNHKDGIRKTLDDRRLAPFFTAQQHRQDLLRDGMDAAYFQRLAEWLHGGGFAIVTDFLHSYEIKAAYNPALMSEAPATSSTGEALASGLGGIEQEVLEATEQGRTGFSGGWVSSIALDRLIEQRKDSRRLPFNKRKDVMEALGYILHPNLPGGRVGSMVAIDGGSKPRLYIKRGHLHCQLVGNPAIVEAYVKAQEMGGVNAVAAEVFKNV